jgi:molybdate transport system substrate-binding protein
MKKLLPFFLVVSGAFFQSARAAEQPVEIVVSAAISMKEALSATAKDFEASNEGVKVLLNFASSGALQKQIENGAPVEVFVSAGAKEMNALDQEALLAPGSRTDLLDNSLVLITPKAATTIHTLDDLQAPEVKRIAVGDPKSVPAGLYAKQALTWAKLAETLQPKLVLGENVRQVLAYVESGNVDAGIVYATDAKASQKVRVAAVLPAESHEAIVYPAAVLKAAKQPKAAAEFLAFLRSETAQKEFEKYGFQLHPAAAAK